MVKFLGFKKEGGRGKSKKFRMNRGKGSKEQRFKVVLFLCAYVPLPLCASVPVYSKFYILSRHRRVNFCFGV